MIQIAILSFLSTFGAAVVVTAFVLQAPRGRYLLRASVGSLLSTAGVATSMFVLGGFGWGWPDLTPTHELLLLVTGGLCIGLFHAAFGWIVSRSILPVLARSLLLTNAAVSLIPSEYGGWPKSTFLLVNFLLLAAWIAKAQPREAAP
jgi:hypothetical protein